MTTHIDRCSIAFRRGEWFARVKRGRSGPIKTHMEFTHSCSFCGWSRPGATSVMLEPQCPECGCALDARRAAAPARPVAAPFSLPPLTMLLLTRGALLLVVLALYAAAKLGYDNAGVSGALVAVGAAGFLLLPCVPGRIG